MSAWRSAPGGSTAAERWICALENGRRAFVKWSDEDADRPVLVLEDLSHATWPPPYIDRVLASISDVAATPVPPGLPRLADQQSEVFTGWTTVARDPRAFLSLGP